MPDIPDELLAKRRITESDCWEWTGATCPAGYGTTYFLKRKQRVHRVVAHLAHDLDLGDSMQVARHRCDNPPCFNPDHIQVGTPRDNRQDCVARGRAIRDTCKRGHPFTGDNVLYGTNSRLCRTCRHAALARYRERKRLGLVGNA